MHLISSIKAPSSPRLNPQAAPGATTPVGLLVLSMSGQDLEEDVQVWERCCDKSGMDCVSLQADTLDGAYVDDKLASLQAELIALCQQGLIGEKSLVMIHGHGTKSQAGLQLGNSHASTIFDGFAFISAVVNGLDIGLGRKWQGLLNIGCCYGKELVPWLAAQGIRAIVYSGRNRMIGDDAVDTFCAVIREHGQRMANDPDRDFSSSDISGLFHQATLRSGEHISLVMGEASQFHKSTGTDFAKHPKLIELGKRARTFYAKLDHGSIGKVKQVLGNAPQEVLGERYLPRISPLFLCVRSTRDRKEKIELLLTLGEQVDEQDECGSSALHFSAYRNDLQVAQALLARGANPALRNRDGELALHMATQPKVLLALLGACKPAGQPLEFKALHVLKDDDQADLVLFDEIVEAGVALDSRDADGRTALHYALRLDKPGLMQKLVEHGAELHATDGQGQSVLARMQERYALDRDRRFLKQNFRGATNKALAKQARRN